MLFFWCVHWFKQYYILRKRGNANGVASHSCHTCVAWAKAKYYNSTSENWMERDDNNYQHFVQHQRSWKTIIMVFLYTFHAHNKNVLVVPIGLYWWPRIIEAVHWHRVPQPEWKSTDVSYSIWMGLLRLCVPCSRYSTLYSHISPFIAALIQIISVKPFRSNNSCWLSSILF